MTLRGGIDLGGTKIQAVVIDEDHEVRGRARRATPRSGGPSDVARAIVETLREALQDAGVEGARIAADGARSVADGPRSVADGLRARADGTRDGADGPRPAVGGAKLAADGPRLAGVGVGSPGHCDAERGTVARAGNLPGWDEPYPLAPVLSQALGVPVFLGNDVGVALDAEARLGAGRDCASFVGVFWGTGIGGGVVLSHERWLGRGASGELGHMVVKRNGARCPCGRRGCVEAYAGRRAMEAKARRDVRRGAKTDLFRIMEKKGRDQLASGVFAEALERGDEYTERLLERAVRALGAGIASACNLLDVEAVVIGGGLGTRLGEPWAARIARAMEPHLFTPERPPVVRVAALGDFAGAIGASLLVAPSRARPAEGVRA